MLEFSLGVVLIEVRVALIRRAAYGSAAYLSAVVIEVTFGQGFHVVAVRYIYAVKGFERVCAKDIFL